MLMRRHHLCPIPSPLTTDVLLNLTSEQGNECEWKEGEEMGGGSCLTRWSFTLTCLEDLTNVAILSTSKLPAWDPGFFWMNNLVFGT